MVAWEGLSRNKSMIHMPPVRATKGKWDHEWVFHCPGCGKRNKQSYKTATHKVEEDTYMLTCNGCHRGVYVIEPVKLARIII